MPRALIVFMAALLTLPVIAVVLLATGARAAASLVGLGGTVVVTFLTLLYVVMVDSRRRWPGLSAWQRFARVVTFYR